MRKIILLRLGWWIRGWGCDFLYEVDEIERCFKLLFWKGVCIRVCVSKSSGIWEVFLIGWLKWNVDVFVSIEDGRAGIGGVLRDWKENLRCIFFIFV